MAAFTRVVWLLSLVSLFTDMASEMLYPVMPLYLQTIGFSAVGIGLLEGLAEATAGLSKGYFGKLSDLKGRRAPFVQWGYALSALSKPLMAVWTHPAGVFTARTADRIGKGLRTGARDAMLAAEADKSRQARIFGFHRGWDTLGAALGPALALLFLWQFPGAYRTLFLLAAAPGLVAIVLTLLLKDKKTTPSDTKIPLPSLFSFLKYWKQSPQAYRRLVPGLLVFALINSSDLFLLMLMKERGMSDTLLIGIYIFYNLVYALMAYPAGSLADRLGSKPVFLGGLGLFALVYAGMGLATEIWHFGALFFLYGCYAAGTEGVAKAWISRLIPANEKATAFGTYEGFKSIAALLSGLFAGLVWEQWGASALFLATAVLVVPVGGYLYRIRSA